MQSLRILAILLVASASAKAADVDVQRLDNGSALILIDGDFEHDDIETFRTKVASLRTAKVGVAFRSEGGSLVAGIRIGGLIREKKYTTIVPDGAACASACALAWLGGTRRYMGQGASVGFHAAYVLKSYGPIESGSGNAILGAYLNQLGLSEDAIVYITKTAPTSIQWMNLRDATEHGIAVLPLSPQQVEARASTAATAEQHEGTPERRATDFVRSLLAHWSKPSTEALPALEGLYAETVRYNGKATPRQSVLASKQGLAERWTERAYSIQPGSLSTTCATGSKTCRVKGVVNWKYYNPKTAKKARGAANFEYRVALAGDAPQIVAETRSVQEQQTMVAAQLKEAQKNFQKLLGRVSKLIQ
jgi:hypothetical protein